MDTLEVVIEDAVGACGLTLYGFQWHPRDKTLRVFVEGDNAVDVAACQAVSRQLRDTLAVNETIRGDYSLEVSSPGIQRPLLKPAHYMRCIGETIDVTLKRSFNERRHMCGELKKLEGDTVELLVDGETVHIQLADITKAHLVVDIRF